MHELILLTLIEIIPRKVLGRDILAARREAEKEQNGEGDSSADEGDGERMDTSADDTVNTTATTTGESWHNVTVMIIITDPSMMCILSIPQTKNYEYCA